MSNLTPSQLARLTACRDLLARRAAGKAARAATRERERDALTRAFCASVATALAASEAEYAAAEAAEA